MPMPFQSETKPVIMLQRHSRNLYKKETPQFLQTDKGTDFMNKKTQALLKTHNVKWFTTEHLTKAQMVE